MIPDERLEPFRDEHGGVWRFYKGSIPGTNAQYPYTLQLPPEIHNYVIDRYIGTNEQGQLPNDFRFTPQMMKDITQQWEAMNGEPPRDMTVFRAAVEETVKHRYYRQQEQELDFDELVEQRERVVNEPLDLDRQETGHSGPEPYGVFSTPVSYQPGQQIKDERGNVYEVTTPSRYNEELGLYDTPARFVQARSFDEQTTKAIKELGADINLMNEQEVHAYADLKMSNPSFELNKWEREQFTRQEQLVHQEPPPLLDKEGKPIDIEQIYKAIDEGQLGEVGPEHGDAFVRQDLLEPAPLNFGQSVNGVADFMRERAQGFERTINDITDTFGR